MNPNKIQLNESIRTKSNIPSNLNVTHQFIKIVCQKVRKKIMFFFCMNLSDLKKNCFSI